MSDVVLQEIRQLLGRCSPEEEALIFRELRKRHRIHEFEDAIGAPAEMILEAVHRAPELTRRMLRGVIADAAFRSLAIDELAATGWRDVTPEGNFAYDYKVEDRDGPVTVQVKLQRSDKGKPLVRRGKPFGFDQDVFIVETQKTRTGSEGGTKTRPYRFGEFDVLAVSLQPSTNHWNQFRFTLGRWLIPAKDPQQIATIQPVTTEPGEYWTDDFNTVAQWFRARDGGRHLRKTLVVKK